MHIVEQGVDGNVSSLGVFEGRAYPLCQIYNSGSASKTLSAKTTDHERTTSVGIRLPSAYTSLRSCTKSHSNPKIRVVAVSRCLLCSGLADTLPIEVISIDSAEGTDRRYSTKA
jgi:hypothetical protein